MDCLCQVAPAELESVLLSHPLIVDAAVIPYDPHRLFSLLFSFSLTFLCGKKCCRVEDEETGQIPMAYVVRAAGSQLTEDQVIQFVAGQVGHSWLLIPCSKKICSRCNHCCLVVG